MGNLFLQYRLYSFRSNYKCHEKHESTNPGCSKGLEANLLVFHSISFLNCFSCLLFPFFCIFEVTSLILWRLNRCLSLRTIACIVQRLFCSLAFNWGADVRPMKVKILFLTFPKYALNEKTKNLVYKVAYRKYVRNIYTCICLHTYKYFDS